MPLTACGAPIIHQPNNPRPDLREVQRFVSRSLHPSKWPMLLVYMDETPKNNT